MFFLYQILITILLMLSPLIISIRILKKKEDKNLSVFLEYDGPIKAPILIGEKIAIVKVFKKDEDKAESFDDLERLAERKAFHEFGTDEPKTEWAEQICKIAEENAEDISAYESLAEWIRNTLGNEKWAKLIDQKAKELEDDNQSNCN